LLPISSEIVGLIVIVIIIVNQLTTGFRSQQVGL
jgi:hypothetical protein